MAQFSIVWADYWNGKTERENQHSENLPKKIELHKKWNKLASLGITIGVVESP